MFGSKMLISISTQSIGGSYQDTKGQRFEIKTLWNEEAMITTSWGRESLLLGEYLFTENNLVLQTERGPNLELEKIPTTTWTEEAFPSSVWSEEVLI